MLILGRKVEPGKDTIMLNMPEGLPAGASIRFQLCEVRSVSQTARIGIDAPKEVQVLRGEIPQNQDRRYDTHPFAADALVLQE